MKIKVGYKWKSIEGPMKGKWFTVTQTGPKEIIYRSEETGTLFTAERKHFEKYIQRVNAHWSETNKNYKHKKNSLRNE